MIEGVAVGFLTCGLFVLLPLAPVRLTPPLLALRSAFEAATPQSRAERWRDPLRWTAYGLLAVALAFFPWLQSNNAKLGFGFSGALLVSLRAARALTARGLMNAARRWFPTSWPFEWRQGLGNLYRPNNRTLLLVFTLGLITFLLLGMYLTKDILLHQFDTKESTATQPNLIFFDIQPDQKAAVTGHRARARPARPGRRADDHHADHQPARPGPSTRWRRRNPPARARAPCPTGGCGTSTARRTATSSTPTRRSSFPGNGPAGSEWTATARTRRTPPRCPSRRTWRTKCG